jgi:hypothetical protein
VLELLLVSENVTPDLGRAREMDKWFSIILYPMWALFHIAVVVGARFEYPFCLNMLCWNIPSDWIFRTGISLLPEYAMLEHP